MKDKQIAKNVPYLGPFELRRTGDVVWVSDSEGRQVQYEGEGSLFFLKKDRATILLDRMNDTGRS